MELVYLIKINNKKKPVLVYASSDFEAMSKALGDKGGFVEILKRYSPKDNSKYEKDALKIGQESGSDPLFLTGIAIGLFIGILGLLGILIFKDVTKDCPTLKNPEQYQGYPIISKK